MDLQTALNHVNTCDGTCGKHVRVNGATIEQRKLFRSHNCRVGAFTRKTSGGEERRKAATQTPEYREKQAQISSSAWKDPEIREARLSGHSIAMAKPEYHAKLSAIQKTVQNDPEQKERRAATFRETIKDPEVRARYKAAAIKRAADPDISRKLSEAHTRRWANKASREEQSLRMKACLAQPEVRANHVKAFSDPLRSKRISDGNIQNYKDDPTRRARRAKTLAAQRGRENKLEYALREALGRPHEEIPMWHWNYDMSFPEHKTLVEVQGCFWHNCHTCNFAAHKDAEYIKRQDKAKANYAKKMGWRVIEIWEHDAKLIISNPKKWLKDNGLI